MFGTNLSFITLILTKWAPSTDAYMLWTAEYCISNLNAFYVLQILEGEA